MVKRIEWIYGSYMNDYTAFNKKEEILGRLVLLPVGSHKHWCWEQEDDIHMSPSCLGEVSMKMRDLWQDRKSK